LRSLRILGVDPGREGALVVLNGLFEVVDKFTMPLDAKTKAIHLGRLFEIVSAMRYTYSTCYIEKTKGFRRDSSGRAFTFGYNTGVIHMALAANGNPVVMVEPKVWQMAVHPMIGVRGGIHAKERTLRCCRKRWPGMDWRKTPKCKKFHDGLMDAALIAYYGVCHKYGDHLNDNN